MNEQLPERAAQRPGSAMLRRFGWFYHVLGLGPALSRLRFEEHSVEHLRSAHAQGPVVYVLSERRAMDHLALNTQLNQRRLPLSVWANGVRSFFWQPVADAWRDLFQGAAEDAKQDPIGSGWLSRTLASGETITLFLDEPARWPWQRGPVADPLTAVIDAQAQSERPIQLVPIFVAWRRSPDRKRSPVLNFLQGAVEAPSFLTQLWQAWVRGKDAWIQAGEALDLQSFIERVPEDHRAPALRRLLSRYLHREAQVVRGPRLLPYKEMQHIVLDNPPMRELARVEAQAAGLSEVRVRKRMSREYRQIAAHFRWYWIQALYYVLRPLWTRVFSGVDARPDDIERVRQAMREGSIVLLPCHKSHFDFLLLSWVFYAHDFIVPHVVAGNNLAIWPISAVLRGAGGFFVKRSFAGDRLHPAIFSRYLRELILQGYPVEFFMEGGRTRTGRLLPAKVGVLGMVLEAAEVRRRDREVTLLPLSLSYEQIAEEGAYARELGGEDKQPETMAQLVRARSVLKRRFGRVYLRVGEPIKLSAMVDASDAQPMWSERPRDAQKAQLHRLGERVMHRIGLATVLLPTSLVALALLSHHRMGMTGPDLVARIARIRALLARRGAQESVGFERFDEAITQALDRFRRDGRIEAQLNGTERIWRVLPEQRLTLDFYKNQVLHFLTPVGLAALALRALPEGPVTEAELLGPFLNFTWVLRRELRLDPDAPASASLSEGVEELRAYGAIARDDEGRITVRDPERIGELYGLFRPIVESYLLVLRCHDLLATPLSKKDFVKKVLQRGRTLLDAGSLTRPEALSMVTLQHAVEAWREEEVFTESSAGLVPALDRILLREAALAPAVTP